MAIVQRHRRLLLATIFIVGLAGLLVATLTTEAEALDAPDAAPPLPLDTWSQIVQLRDGLALSPAALASAGVAGAQAEELFQSARAWCEQNEARLAAADAEVLAARRSLRQALRDAHVGAGQVTVNDIKTLRERLGQAEADRRVLWEEFLPALDSHVDAEGRAILATIRSNRDAVPDPYHPTPDLTEPQAQGLHEAVARYGPGSQETREAEQQLLSSPQRDALNQARQLREQRVGGVLAAEAKVLVRPVELQEVVDPPVDPGAADGP